MILLIFFILQIVSPLWKNYISDLLIQSSSQLAATVSMRFTAMDDASRRMEYAYETYINTSPTVSNMLESSADLINTMAGVYLQYRCSKSVCGPITNFFTAGYLFFYYGTG